MTRNEGINQINSAIEKVKSFISQIQAIPGSNNDKACQSYIQQANQFIVTYSNYAKQYAAMSEEEFASLDLYYIFKFFNKNLNSLEHTCKSLVARGPKHKLGSPTKKGPYIIKTTSGTQLPNNMKDEVEKMYSSGLEM